MRAQAIHSFELLSLLVSKEIKIRYKNTLLGFIWSLANPLMFALVFYFVFEHLLSIRGENFFAFLVAGIFPWQWFASSVSASPMLFLSNAGLIKKVRFPRILLPISMVGNNLIHFLMALLIAIPILAAYGYYPRVIWLIGIPVLLILQAALVLGVTLIVSSLNVFFRDLEYISNILVQLLFFLTPILYSASTLPPRVAAILKLNPLYYIIPVWRNLMMSGTLDLNHLAIGGLCAGTVLGLGYWIYHSLEWRFAESI